MAVLSTAYNMDQEHLIEGCTTARQMLMALWEGINDAFHDETKSWEAISEELNVWINETDDDLGFLNNDRLANMVRGKTYGKA
jgi:hypothetical protein